ncbi:MAG: NUDIX hydrolase [Deltaproteobacteria bacterium]|nr:MAG: NUDIX hydrolase [Deltaproteobacteria bacterium]
MGGAGRQAPTVAVDVAVFTVIARALHLLLVQVQHGAFRGRWALPGGRVGVDESLDQAARRELTAQTGLSDVYLEQLYTFGSPQRDPHGRVVSVAYVALIAHSGRFANSPAPTAPRQGKYAAVAWRRVTRLPPLAYDHRAVVRTALARLRAKLAYTNLAYTLLPRAFTLGELQEMYEAILGRRLDRRNFRKKVLSLGLLRPLARVRRGSHRPARLHAFQRRRPMIIEVL